jgi:two-component system, response regulator
MNQQKCILVVEDDPTDLFLLRRGFGKAGLAHKLAHVRSVEEALDYLAGVPPFSDRDEYPFADLLLLDLKMPGMNGFELLRQLRDHPELGALPVVVLSNSPLKSDTQLAKSLGAREFLTKPISTVEYRNIVLGLHQRWLGGVIPSTLNKP